MTNRTLAGTLSGPGSTSKTSPEDDDFWCEDESLSGLSDDGLSHTAVLNREWKWRHDQFHIIGYRDGTTAGKEASAQEGFILGFKQSVHVGHKWGLVRGISTALSNLSDQLKGKLSGTPENKVRLQKLYESAQTISSNDAIKIFYGNFQQTATRQPEESFRETIMENEDLGCNQLEELFKELISLLHVAPEVKVNVDFGRETGG